MAEYKQYLEFSRHAVSGAARVAKRAWDSSARTLRYKTVQESREMKKQLADLLRPAPGIMTELVSCAGVTCQWVYSLKSPTDKVILYIHGGSWAFGTLDTARAAASLLADATDVRVLSVEYRLAPEQPFPAGLEDCIAVYRWLLRNGFLHEDIALVGDSAGGNLCLSMQLLLHSEGEASPCACALISPATNLSPDAEIAKRSPDFAYTIHEGVERDIFSLYGAGHDLYDPLISPVYGDLSGLCPMLIHVGGDESLAGDCDIFAQKAMQSGVSVRLKIWRGMFHNFTLGGGAMRESRRSLRELAAFLRKRLGLED